MEDLTINDKAIFIWDFGMNFFLQTNKGNFIWRDPNCNGDNTIVKFDGSLKDYFNGSFGRNKGEHIISDYCGKDVKIIKS